MKDTSEFNAKVTGADSVTKNCGVLTSSVGFNALEYPKGLIYTRKRGPYCSWLTIMRPGESPKGGDPT